MIRHGARDGRIMMAIAILVTAVAAGCVASSVLRARATGGDGSAELPDGRQIVFRSLRPGPAFGHIAAVPAAEPRGERVVLPTRCERTAASAAGGLCLRQTRNPVRLFTASLMDDRLRPGKETPLNGIPSRARISEDGRYYATTAFVTGHSYLSDGFSTETVIGRIGGDPVGNIEQFTFMLNGQPNGNVDRNVWGVTFVPGGQRFFATVATQNRRYLVEGDIGRRTLTALRENVECPSLSPNGQRLVYKKRTGSNSDVWRFHTLDLATGVEAPLAETRSVDDQAAWLDDDHVMYGVPKGGAGGRNADVWVVALRGGAPRILIPDADSPTVRTPSPARLAP
ncbi:WD40 repeat protein [Actinomadura pelletieri DSM 43383]|uniref:WD40 repeat protein n=1 Tax=Actinomadura pelletieri DSM 43383 TaxID=1120940 RepID=A0A495Q9K3_9ACTN|nr:PD40 domain-containing protein [Actinomadura pelletieri]RKS68179.1 WD40 repeat protein [Actinomadura pelletieri DSM 43383]